MREEARRWKLILGRPFEKPSKEENHEVDRSWEREIADPFRENEGRLRGEGEG